MSQLVNWSVSQLVNKSVRLDVFSSVYTDLLTLQKNLVFSPLTRKGEKREK